MQQHICDPIAIAFHRHVAVAIDAFIRRAATRSECCTKLDKQAASASLKFATLYQDDDSPGWEMNLGKNHH
jgi:hypothetical protein